MVVAGRVYTLMVVVAVEVEWSGYELKMMDGVWFWFGGMNGWSEWNGICLEGYWLVSFFFYWLEFLRVLEVNGLVWG